MKTVPYNSRSASPLEGEEAKAAAKPGGPKQAKVRSRWSEKKARLAAPPVESTALVYLVTPLFRIDEEGGLYASLMAEPGICTWGATNKLYKYKRKKNI